MKIQRYSEGRNKRLDGRSERCGKLAGATVCLDIQGVLGRALSWWGFYFFTDH